jgi:hypothetical protein
VLGVLAKNKSDASGCEESVCPTKAAINRNDEALRFAHASTVTLALGAAGLAAGAFLVFWPSAKKREAKPGATASWKPALAPGFAGASWGGTW